MMVRGVGVGHVRVTRPVDIPPQVNPDGEVKAPAGSYSTVNDIAIQADVSWPAEPVPPTPTAGLGTFEIQCSVASSAGAGSQSHQGGRGRQPTRSEGDVIRVTVGAGPEHVIDMGQANQRRIGGFVLETSGPQTRSLWQRVMEGVKGFIGA